MILAFAIIGGIFLSVVTTIATLSIFVDDTDDLKFNKGFWWRCYCIYFLKLRLISRILCFIPALVFLFSILCMVIYSLPVIIFLSVCAVSWSVCAVIWKGIVKSRKYLINDSVQCKDYHCKRGVK